MPPVLEGKTAGWKAKRSGGLLKLSAPSAVEYRSPLEWKSYE